MRCYKCQRYGHIAKVCKGKQRCGKCGGDHAYGECGDKERKCCNCGGDHTAAYGGSPVRKKAVVVQQVRTSRNLSYAEAVKVVNEENIPKGESHGSQEANKSQRAPKAAEDMVSTERLVLFIAYVINCADQVRMKMDTGRSYAG